FICDAPARAFVKQVKGHNAYHGCEKCSQNVVWKDKVTFPRTKSGFRNDESFVDLANPDHHSVSCVISPLLHLCMGMVSQFVGSDAFSSSRRDGCR
ncbi:hypothetical protein LOTGIDRAFT_107664, partial [Lottia gigantea]